jgi:hypothetical protein
LGLSERAFVKSGELTKFDRKCAVRFDATPSEGRPDKQRGITFRYQLVSPSLTGVLPAGVIRIVVGYATELHDTVIAQLLAVSYW